MSFYPSAKVICDSITPESDRLITLEVEFHRFVLAEFNTHRVISRNFQSSRAIPTPKLIEMVKNNPVYPLHWGSNQPGMQAGDEINEDVFMGIPSYRGQPHSREMAWGYGAKQAAKVAQAMWDAGYHKQIVNRIIEPYLPVKGVVTATYDHWQGFFKLRSHHMAQPEIRALSDEIKKAIEESEPEILDYGEWHLPYVNRGYHTNIGIFKKQLCTVELNTGLVEELSLEQAIKISVSCCAQVSYRNLDDSLEKAEKVYERLNLPSKGKFPEDPPHFSPAEHVAVCRKQEHLEENPSKYGGNFQTINWYQFRKLLEQGKEEEFIS